MELASLDCELEVNDHTGAAHFWAVLVKGLAQFGEAGGLGNARAEHLEREVRQQEACETMGSGCEDLAWRRVKVDPCQSGFGHALAFDAGDLTKELALVREVAVERGL